MSRLGQAQLMAVVLVMSLDWSLGARAADPKPLRVAMSGQYLPLHGEQDGGQAGFEVDVATQLGQLLGRPVVFLSRAELGQSTLAAVAGGAADLGLSAITPTAERAKVVDFTRPICAVRYRVVHDGSMAPCQREVLAARGPTYQAARTALGRVARQTRSEVTAVRMVSEGRAHCAVVEEPALALYRKELPALRVSETPVGSSPIAIAVPKGRASEIDALLEEAEQYLDELAVEWGVDRTDVTTPRIEPHKKWPAALVAPATTTRLTGHYFRARAEQAVLRREPGTGAEVNADTAREYVLVQLERRGNWLKVRAETREVGWLPLSEVDPIRTLEELMQLKAWPADFGAPRYGATPLSIAAMAGMLDVVRLLLERGVDVNAVDANRRTALEWAAHAGNDAVVRALVEAGADVNASRGWKQSPLELASRSLGVDTIEWLVANGAHHEAATQDGGARLLSGALWQGDERLFDFWWRAGARLNDATQLGDALVTAARGGSATLTQRLLAAGADVSFVHQGTDRANALQTAAFHKHVDVVRVLLDAGALPNVASKRGHTPLMLAFEEPGTLGAVPWLTVRSSRMADAERIAEMLLAAEASVGALDRSGWNALMYASRAGAGRAVLALLRAGADPGHASRTSVTEHGRATALGLAARRGHLEVVRQLLDAGAPIRWTLDGKTFGVSALALAAAGGHVQVIELLLGRGARVNARQPYEPLGDEFGPAEGFTALMAAASNGHGKAVRLLLARGANVNVTYEVEISVASEHTAGSMMKHGTALSLACEGRHEEVARLLAANGAKTKSAACRRLLGR